MSDNIIIQTSSLTRRYGSQFSVSDLNLQVRKGSIYGFLGPNGAGKTTTIRMLLGLIKPTAGQVRIFGEELARHRVSILSRIGSLVESPSYYGHLTGYENLEVIGRLLNAPSKRSHEVLEIVRLTRAANKTVKAYSLGMKQRLGIAAALLGSPELIILDEPTNGLDPAGIHEIRELIKEMPKQYGMTVVVSSHLLTEIDQMTTHVGIINKGVLIFEDRIEVLRKKSLTKLIVETKNPEQALQIVQQNGKIAEIQSGSLLFNEVEYQEAAELNKMLVQAGFPVYRIKEMKPSLEDIFLDLVGKEGSL